MVEQLLLPTLEMPAGPLQRSSTIDLKVFKKALQLAVKGVVARSESPWLQLVADGQKLRFITTSIQVTVDCFVEPFQVVAVPKELQAVVKQFDKKVKEVELSSQGLGEYPWPQADVAAEPFLFEGQQASVNPTQLLSALVFLDSFASAKSNHSGFRFENGGVYFLDSREEGVLRCCFVTNYGLEADIFPAFTAPLSILSAAKEMLKQKECTASISPAGLQVVTPIYEAQLLFNYSGEENFPQNPLARITEPANSLVFSRQDTLAAIEVLAGYEGNDGITRLVVMADEARLDKGELRQVISASITTESTDLVYLPFNLKYLKEFLEAITSELVVWNFGSGMTASIQPMVLQPLEGLNYMYTFYPLRVVEYAR